MRDIQQAWHRSQSDARSICTSSILTKFLYGKTTPLILIFSQNMWNLASFVIKNIDKHTFVVRHGLQRNDRSLEKKLQQQDAALLEDIWSFYQKRLSFKVYLFGREVFAWNSYQIERKNTSSIVWGFSTHFEALPNERRPVYTSRDM